MTKFLMALLLAITAPAAERRVVGSDLFGVEFSKALYDFAGHNNLSLALAFDGSRPGLDRLKAGTADLALVVLPAEEDAALTDFATLTIGYHVAVVLAPATTPVERFTLDELAGIFGEGGVMSFSRWGELGLGGAWAIRAIEPHVPAVGRGIAVEFFRHAVLHDRAFKSSVGRYATSAELVTKLSSDSPGLALAASRPAGAAKLKIVPVSVRADEPGFTPTPENVHAGDYPLRLPLRLVFRREAAAGLRPLLRFFFTDEIAAQLERAEVVPLPAGARQQQRAALEKP